MTVTTVNSTIRLPDTLRNWPWQRTLNPHYEECKCESEAWIETFHAFSPKAQRAFNRCNFSLLASLAWANLDKEGCRIGCDLMHLFFVFDEHSDRSTKEETSLQAKAIMDALRNPHQPRPSGEFVGGQVARTFWLNALKFTGPAFQRRFIDSFEHYTNAVIQQSEDRDLHRQRDLQNYLHLRRCTIGAKPSFVVNGMHLDLPDHVVFHPTIKQLEYIATDMIIIGNDIVSYDREQSQPGQAEHNIISVLMDSLAFSIQDAMDWVGRFHDGLVNQFLATYQQVPHFHGESDRVNRDVLEYIRALANWVRASDCWAFESERYFGKDGSRVSKERTIVLRPQALAGEKSEHEVDLEAAIVPEPIPIPGGCVG